MTSCCPPPRMRWSGATGAIARGKRVSTGCGRTRRSARALRWICGVKPTPKAVSKPWHHFIVHGLDKPGGFTTVSFFFGPEACDQSQCLVCELTRAFERAPRGRPIRGEGRAHAESRQQTTL